MEKATITASKTITDLPDELLLLVFGYLDCPDLLALSRVSVNIPPYGREQFAELPHGRHRISCVF